MIVITRLAWHAKGGYHGLIIRKKNEIQLTGYLYDNTTDHIPPALIPPTTLRRRNPVTLRTAVALRIPAALRTLAALRTPAALSIPYGTAPRRAAEPTL